MSSIPGMTRSAQKTFQPLRHQGRLGHVQLSGERRGLPTDFDHMGAMPDTNYKSAGEFHHKNMGQGGLFKSRSQAKQMKPMSKKNENRSNYLNPISRHKNSKTMNYGMPKADGQVHIQEEGGEKVEAATAPEVKSDQ